MVTPLNSQLHYQCSITLDPRRQGDAIWSAIVDTIRSWVSNKEQRPPELLEAWFANAGEFVSPRSSVKTGCIQADGSPSQQQYWALRYDERCREFPHRRWRTDVGLSAIDGGRVQCALRLVHYISAEFVGEEPTPPVATCPSVVKWLIAPKGDGWSSKAGNELLSARPYYLRPTQLQQFCSDLFSTEREIPLIVAATERDSEDVTLIDVEALASKVAGSASVYILPMLEHTYSQINHLLPRQYHIAPGMVRIYQPAIDPKRTTDYQRHRFFTATQIRDKGSISVETIIVRGLARRTLVRKDREVYDLDDLRVRKREVEIRHLQAEYQRATAEKDNPALHEWIRLLEEDNADLRAENEQMKGNLETLNLVVEEKDGMIEESQNSIRALTYAKDDANRRADEAESRYEDCQAALAGINEFKSLPEDLLQALQLAERFYGSSILVLEQAKTSAREWEFDAAKAWKLFWAMAHHLPGLHFSEVKYNIETEFRNRTGFRLGMTEGKQTKKDADARDERMLEYNGKLVDFTPHVKIGSTAPNLLRVHYYADHQAKKIVIGHCGDHLTTAGTRRNR